MSWSKTPPTEPGWYWISHMIHRGEVVRIEPVSVQIAHRKAQRARLEEGEDALVFYPASNKNGQSGWWPVHRHEFVDLLWHSQRIALPPTPPDHGA